jgi:hypothetical protein
VDDMLVTSIQVANHVADLEETFNTLRGYKMRHQKRAMCA